MLSKNAYNVAKNMWNEICINYKRGKINKNKNKI
jgi:hypothetical protein